MQLLSAKLANTLPLPLDASLKLYHVSTPPTPSPAIFKAKPGSQEDATFCESHFLAISVPSPEGSELLALAVEVLIYTTSTLTTIFISKADTTGYLYLDKIPKERDVSKIILKEFMQHVLDVRLRRGQKVLISLFARAQNQYLFPGSIDNKRKRVLPDRELLRWWCRLLDPVLRSSPKATAHVLVAGAQMTDTKRYVYPPSVEDDSPEQPAWSWSYPTNLIAPDPAAPTQCLLPRFPDDPKTRFQEELDGQVAKHGKWTSPKTLDEFWAMMSYRRECYEGTSVGFLWMIFPAAEASNLVNGDTKQKESIASKDGDVATLLSTPAQSQSQLKNTNGVHAPATSDTDAASLSAISLPASSPKYLSIPAPNLSEATPALTSVLSQPPSSPSPLPASFLKPAEDQKFYDAAEKERVSWPAETRGELILSEEQYQSLMDYLLQLDFSDLDVSHESSKSWTRKAAELASSGSNGSWGAKIKGTGHVSIDVFSKKRKADTESMDAVATPLSAGLVRKKPKVKA